MTTYTLPVPVDSSRVVCYRRGNALGGGGGEEVAGGQGCEAATTDRWVTWLMSHDLCHMVYVTWLLLSFVLARCASRTFSEDCVFKGVLTTCWVNYEGEDC